MFYTQDNGYEPFKVEISGSIVNIYKRVVDENSSECSESNENESNENESVEESSENEKNNKYIHILKYEPARVFIGKSPLNKMTEFSGGHGDRYDGNSFLLEMNDNNYIHVGCEIFSFSPKSKIVEYVSCMGNNWVPYPYAVDELGHYYLMIEDVILLNSNNESLKTFIKDGGDPYSYYYARTLITSDEGVIPPTQPQFKFKNIERYFVDDEDGFQQYTLRYHPDTPKEREWNFPNNRKKDHYIKFSNDRDLKFISDEDYFSLMKEFGTLNGFEAFHKLVIEPRHW